MCLLLKTNSNTPHNHLLISRWKANKISWIWSGENKLSPPEVADQLLKIRHSDSCFQIGCSILYWAQLTKCSCQNAECKSNQSLDLMSSL